MKFEEISMTIAMMKVITKVTMTIIIIMMELKIKIIKI